MKQHCAVMFGWVLVVASSNVWAQNQAATTTPTSTVGPRSAGEESRASDAEPYHDVPGATPIGEATRATAESPDQRITLSGFLRTRGDLANNWDLGRGATPSLRSLWPSPYAGPTPSSTQTHADMRLRLDVAIEVGWGVTIRGRVHALDNLRYGSTPEGDFSGGVVTQRSPDRPLDVRQLYGQVLLPFGVLSAGRMGAIIDWGTGFFVNAGSNIDDDTGDVGDRIALTTPLAGLLWSAVYEISASGPSTEALRPEIRPSIDLDSRDDVRTAAFSVTRWDAPITRRRRLAARRTTVNFGVLGSHRWQTYDLPAGDEPTGRNSIRRDLTVWLADAWVRADVGSFTFEAEGAFLNFTLNNASLDAGAMLNIPITGRQFGGVARAEYRGGERFFARIETGFASGDDRPGMGARPTATARPGDLDGYQFDLTRNPRDTTVNNFRFHPNYRVDLILWRRIIGTITDAVYVRPMVRYRIGPMLTVEGSVVASFALEANSTPAGKSPLGVETDVGLLYEQEHGFFARLDYGLLLPLSGLANVPMRVDATVAHALHLVMAWRY
jgi:uncharacterized protein (TIGR04551 family)